MTSFKKHSIIPGLGPTLGFTLFYLSLIILIPLAVLFFKATKLSGGQLWGIITDQRLLASLYLSFTTSFFAAITNVIFGLIVAWVLTRYHFPGEKLADALIDLPFAMPTAVAGIALTSLYASNGLLGHWLEGIGIKVAFTPIGIWVALTFIGLPFVVRTLQPIIQDLDPELEEAAASLGAKSWQTFFRVTLPGLWPGLLTGFGLAFARGLGEYGSVVFISGNMPLRTEIVPLLIVTKLEQYDYLGATAIAAIMLVLSFTLLLSINLLQLWHRKITL